MDVCVFELQHLQDQLLENFHKIVQQQVERPLKSSGQISPDQYDTSEHKSISGNLCVQPIASSALGACLYETWKQIHSFCALNGTLLGVEDPVLFIQITEESL